MYNFNGQSFCDRVSHSNVSNAVTWSKTGYNAAVGGTEDLWTVGGLYVWPTIPMRMEVSSTAAADNAAGAGIQSVTLCYLDANYVEQTEIINMNGVGWVQTAAVNILRVNCLRAYMTGANGVAAGTITLRGTVTLATYDEIVVGFTRSRNDCYTVPAGKCLYVTSIAFSCTSNAAGRQALFTTRATYDDATARLLTAGLFFMPYHEIGIQDGTFYREIEVPTRLPATADIKVSATSTGGDTVCTSILRGFLVTGGRVT